MSFDMAEMKVVESDALVLIDVIRYGPMRSPMMISVTNIPLTAKRGVFSASTKCLCVLELLQY